MSKLKLCVMAAWVALFFSPVFALESPTVSPQTLSVKLTGKTVAVDVYKPRGAHTGAAILTHGGFRGRKTMAEHAQALAERGVLAVAPDMPCTFDHRCNARAIAELVKTLHLTEALGASAKRIMLVGFSAGGLASLLAADSPGVVGFVGLDPYDHLPSTEFERMGMVAARRLATDTLLLRAPPSSCNAQSVAAPWSMALPSLWRDELIAGATHCDFEAPTDWLCRLACGDTDALRQSRVRQGLLDAAARWLR